MPSVLPGQHAAYFYPQPSCQLDVGDRNSSSGSWETTFSADDVSLGAPHFDGFQKGRAGDGGSPMSHLHSYDQVHSGLLQPNLARMASLTLEDGHAYQVRHSFCFGVHQPQTFTPNSCL